MRQVRREEIRLPVAFLTLMWEFYIKKTTYKEHHLNLIQYIEFDSHGIFSMIMAVFPGHFKC